MNKGKAAEAAFFVVGELTGKQESSCQSRRFLMCWSGWLGFIRFVQDLSEDADQMLNVILWQDSKQLVAELSAVLSKQLGNASSLVGDGQIDDAAVLLGAFPFGVAFGYELVGEACYSDTFCGPSSSNLSRMTAIVEFSPSHSKEFV
jgi:hypothetical protein